MPDTLPWEFLQVCKKRLQFCKKGHGMNAGIFVDDARERVKAMIQGENRGPGDLDNAMQRIAGDIGVPYGELWKLRYRPGKSIEAHVYAGIVVGYERWRAEQAAAYAAERNAARPESLAARLFVRAADALVGEGDRSPLREEELSDV